MYLNTEHTSTARKRANGLRWALFALAVVLAALVLGGWPGAAAHRHQFTEADFDTIGQEMVAIEQHWPAFPKRIRMADWWIRPGISIPRIIPVDQLNEQWLRESAR